MNLMKEDRPAAGGMVKGAIADIFMNFGLIATWLLFLSPPHPPIDTVPDQSIPPTERTAGDRAAAGQEVARVNVEPGGQLTIVHQGETYSPTDYFAHLQSNNQPFPDHLVFAFPGFEALQTLGRTALEQDASVSLELRR